MILRRFAIGLLGVWLPFCVISAEADWHVSVMTGKSRFELAPPSFTDSGPVYSSDYRGGAIQLSVGYRINPFLGLELGYLDFGDARRGIGWPDDIAGVCAIGVISPCNGEVRQKIKAKAYTASVIASLPVTKTLDVFAKVGIANLQSRITSRQMSITEKSSENLRNAIYGIGARYLLNEQLALKFEANRSGKMGRASDKLSVNAYTVGIEFRF